LDHHNKFYTSISKHYSEIFPYNPAQLGFVEKKLLQLQDKRILDVGCATGQLAFELAEAGADVVGIDLNDQLLEIALEGIPQPNLSFKTINMLHLSEHFQNDTFEAVLCFGNTLVHLQELHEMKHFFFEVSKVLNDGGYFLLQILNYDHILEDQINKLPLIENDMFRFERRYGFVTKSRLINFDTDLYLKSEDETISNQTQLFALKSRELEHLLEQEGFTDIQLFANFNGDPFGGKHLPLVLSCRK